MQIGGGMNIIPAIITWNNRHKLVQADIIADSSEFHLKGNGFEYKLFDANSPSFPSPK